MLQSWDRPHAGRPVLNRAAGAAGAFLGVGDGLRCLRPGVCPEPRGRGDHHAVARDPQLARGGGFRRDTAAVSELPGQRSSEPGASRSLGPRRLPLCPSYSVPRSGPAALVVGLPVESFFLPQLWEICPNLGVL